MAVEYTKDPNARLDYGFDWAAWLGTDTITASTWAVDPSGPTLSSQTFSTTRTTVWVAGGAAGTSYKITNHITTAAGREDDRTFKLKVKEQ